MKLDTKTIGELCFKLGTKIPEAEITVIKAKDIDEVIPAEGHEQDDIIKLTEGDKCFGLNLTELVEGIDSIEDMLTFIEYQYSNEYIMSEKNEDRLKNDIQNFEKIVDKLFIAVEKKADADNDESEGLCTKPLKGTDLSMFVLLDISEYCHEMTDQEKKVFFIPVELCEELWEISQEKLFEIAIENTGNVAYAKAADDLIDKDMTDEEKQSIDEAYRQGKELEKFERENSNTEDETHSYDDWDDYESDWDEETEKTEEKAEETEQIDKDLYSIDANALCLYGPHGLYGLSTICDRRFMMELCNEKMVQAAYIFPLSQHECLFLPDIGYDRFLLRKDFKEDLQNIKADDDMLYPAISENIYRYSLSEGLSIV